MVKGFSAVLGKAADDILYPQLIGPTDDVYTTHLGRVLRIRRVFHKRPWSLKHNKHCGWCSRVSDTIAVTIANHIHFSVRSFRTRLLSQ